VNQTIEAARRVLAPIATPERLLKVNDAALVAGLNPETIRRRIRRGQIRAWGFPHRVLLDDVLQPYARRSGSSE
jgi:hypothetical protein